MYRMSKKEKNLFLITIIFVSCVILYRTVLLPVIGKSVALNRQIQLKRRMIENSLGLLDQREDIQRESRKYTTFIKQELSEEEEAESLLKEIEEIARKSQVQLIDLKPYSAKRKDFYTEHKVEIETESDMNQLITFIHNLQSSESLLKIVKFRISPKADKTSIIRTYLTITRILISD